MMEVNLKLETCKCGKERAASENYCGKCGTKFKTQMRSENEIKAMLEKIEATPPTNAASLAMHLMTILTLTWVQGSSMGPDELLKVKEKAAP